MATAGGLNEEIDFLESAKEELRRRHLGRFLVIRDRAVVGSFESEEEAYREGVRQCGTAPFLLAHIEAHDERAWIPLLLEVEREDRADEEEFVPHSSWRRGKFIDDPIIEVLTPPPREVR